MLLWLALVILAALILLILWRMISLNTEIELLMESNSDTVTVEDLRVLLKQDVFLPEENDKL